MNFKNTWAPMQKADDDVYYYRCPRCGREYRTHGQTFDLKSAREYPPLYGEVQLAKMEADYLMMSLTATLIAPRPVASVR